MDSISHLPPLARRIALATQNVFGESPITRQVIVECQRYTADVKNIDDGRGVEGLLIAVVGAKGQGKTWVTRQFIKDIEARASLPSGDLSADATVRLTWVGQTPPAQLDAEAERFVRVSVEKMVSLGQPYTLLDTPGTTDENVAASDLAKATLALAPMKLLVVDRSQLRAAANLAIGSWIDGSLCIPIITAIEPEELGAGGDSTAADKLRSDLRAFRQRLQIQAPLTEFCTEVLVPDFETTGDEEAAGVVCVGSVLDRIADCLKSNERLLNTAERRHEAAKDRLRRRTSQTIHESLPKLADAVRELSQATSQLPEQVLESLLGSSSVLETGVRMRLRARMVSDTSLLWFPYRTVMSTLNLTQGAWDRLLLALGGSVPSMFGSLASLAQNVKATRDFSGEMQNGISRRAQQQVEERLQPLCDKFHRTLMRMRSQEAQQAKGPSPEITLHGVELLQAASQEIFDEAIDQNAVPRWQAQLQALVGLGIFWSLLAGPVIVVYRDYLSASYAVFTGNAPTLANFPHPTPGLMFTSLLLSTLPLLIFCMVVLTLTISQRKVSRVADGIVRQHQEKISQMREQDVIRLEFDDDLLSDTQFLVQLGER